ncbi:MAG: PHB depolymerase family esterase [Candidatus Sulfotelmatobacter sp.]
MTILQRSLALTFCGFLLAAPALAKDKMKTGFKFEGKWRTYYFFAPDKEGPLPLVVLLHGSGRNGAVMADAWKGLALKEQFIIAAPDSYDSAAWQSDKDSPSFIRAMVEQVDTQHPVDASRIYLFGHSGGAVYALMLALVESEYFAATAVHAGALSPENYNLFARAKRRMPIAIWVGDRDSFFPVNLVTATKKEFESHGFHVELSILPNQTHSYVAADVNGKAWEFFQKTAIGE